MTKNHESEMASLVRKMQEQSDSTVRRLREVSMETVAMPTVTGATEKELGRLRELEDLIGQQRATHEAKMADVRRERELERREYETSLVRVRQEMGELRSSHFIENESEYYSVIKNTLNGIRTKIRNVTNDRTKQ